MKKQLNWIQKTTTDPIILLVRQNNFISGSGKYL